MARLPHRDRLSQTEMAALSPYERELRTSAAAIPVRDFVPFLLWLSKQSSRDDVTGKFARYVKRLEQLRGGCFAALVPLLCAVHSSGDGPAITMLDLALAEWRRECMADRRTTT